MRRARRSLTTCATTQEPAADGEPHAASASENKKQTGGSADREPTGCSLSLSDAPRVPGGKRVTRRREVSANEKALEPQAKRTRRGGAPGGPGRCSKRPADDDDGRRLRTRMVLDPLSLFRCFSSCRPRAASRKTDTSSGTRRPHELPQEQGEGGSISNRPAALFAIWTHESFVLF